MICVICALVKLWWMRVQAWLHPDPDPEGWLEPRWQTWHQKGT
jgi:hypothetical protein